MLKINRIKNILKVSCIFPILFQLSCAQYKERENIIVASAGKIESLDPAQANTLRTLQILSALGDTIYKICLLYTSPSPRDATLSRMPSSA